MEPQAQEDRRVNKPFRHCRIGWAAAIVLCSEGLFVAISVPAGEARDTRSDTWVATDALGRTLPGFAECGAPRANKTVGIFYFVWLGSHGRDLFDITELLARNPTAPPYGPPGAFHFWGQPHLGYYLSTDEFVIRKHAQMLADAGVDVLILDVTNAFTYDDVVQTLCRVFVEIRKTGRTTPQLCFIANSSSEKTVQNLYDRFYAKNRYPELWFRWKGKPLLLAPPERLSPEAKAFFTLRHSWAWSDPKGWFKDGRDKWTWVDHFPQKPGWHEDPGKPEQISVAVAQHPVSNIGRSFHDGKQPPPDRIAPEKGLCFAEQWRRALEVDPEFVFITGWNEWVAQRFVSDGKGPGFLGHPTKKGETFFVDQYNQEFSRDIEPMKGGHGDNYYYQMVSYIRRYKGVRPLPAASAPRSIRLDGGFEQWMDVAPEYLDDAGDTAHRDHPGYNNHTRYVNESGRNDLIALKVARDRENLFFYARTREPLTPSADPNWMMLFIDIDRDFKTGWNGYDYVVNRTMRGQGVSVLEKNAGGWKWEAVGEATFVASGHQLHLAIPRAALGLTTDKGPLRFDFKWADNVPDTGDIMQFIDWGDVAPNARFNFRYEAQ